MPASFAVEISVTSGTTAASRGFLPAPTAIARGAARTASTSSATLPGAGIVRALWSFTAFVSPRLLARDHAGLLQRVQTMAARRERRRLRARKHFSRIRDRQRIERRPEPLQAVDL